MLRLLRLSSSSRAGGTPMIGSIALMLLGAAAAPTPCEGLAALKLDKTTITSAQLIPEGPPPAAAARGGGGGGRGAAAGGRGDGRGGDGQGARGRGAADGPQGGRAAAAGPRGGGPPAAPAPIPAHCRVELRSEERRGGKEWRA